MRSFFIKGLIIFSIIIMGVGIANADTWVKTIAANNDTYFYRIKPIQTIDGGYIFAGGVYGSASAVGGVVKLDVNWNIQWQKNYSITGQYWMYEDIKQTSDGGYIVAGYIGPSNGALELKDALVIKLDSIGNVQWYYAYGGDAEDRAYSILQTLDGGYIFAGQTHSFGESKGDAWVVKLDANGNIQWEKSFGGSSGYEGANSIQQTSDGGYIVGAEANSIGAGSPDSWVIKLDSAGNIQWHRTYGNTTFDYGLSVQQTMDGGFILNSYRASSTGAQPWLLKLDANGNIKWQKAFNGNELSAVYLTDDGGYLVGGIGHSNISTGVSDNFYILKLDGAGFIQWQKMYDIQLSSMPVFLSQAIGGGYIAAGTTATFSTDKKSNIWIMKLDSNGGLSGTTCNLDVQSNITAINTNATIKVNPTITVLSTKATITSSQLDGVETQATITTQCISNATNNCAATLSNELSLHVPVINFNNNQAYYWADFAYVPNTINFTLINAGILTDTSPFDGCSQSSLSANLNLHVPKITFGSASYWADLQYAHDLLFTLTGVGQN